jgi:uncharacterized membrane protein HdeD (DUF308 family)
MLESLARHWWVLLVRGLAAIAFGVMAFAWPGLTLAVLVTLFGAFVLVDGVFAVIAALRARNTDSQWWHGLLYGVLSIGIGVITWVNPGVTALVLVLYIAAWALVSGVFQIAAAIRLRKEIEGEWLMILAGIASVAFGGLLFWAPGAGALALLWWIAVWAIVVGVLLVMLAFKLRRHASAVPASA